MLTLFKSDTPEMRNPWFQVAKPRVLGRESAYKKCLREE